MPALPYQQVQQNNRGAMQRIIAKPGFRALPPADQLLFQQWAQTGDAPPDADSAIDRAVQAGVIENGPSALQEFGTAALLAGGMSFLPAAGVGSASAPAAGTVAAAAPAAGTTFAATAPAVTAAAAHPFLSAALPSLVSGIFGTAAQIYGANKQANAEREASQVQSKYNEEALQAAREAQMYQRGQYANYLARLQPYQASGQQAITRLSDILGNTPVPQV